MTDIVEFVRARLDERAKTAVEATMGPWQLMANGAVVSPTNGDPEPVLDGDSSDIGNLIHIAANDPAYVLADVAAKRLIIELHADDAHECREIHTGTYGEGWPESDQARKVGMSWRHASSEHFEEEEPCPTVRLLALPFAAHSDYRAEWTL